MSVFVRNYIIVYYLNLYYCILLFISKYVCNLYFRQSKGERPVVNNEASYETKLLLMKCKQLILFNDNRN